MFELYILMELIIVPYFWFALFPIIMSDTTHPYSNKPLHIRMGLIMDHSLPFLSLMIELFFLSGTPIVARHFSVAAVFGWLYLIFNCIYTIKVGNIHPPFKWDSDSQFIGLPLGFTAGGALVFCLGYFAVKFKLKKLGHKKIFKVLYGKSSERV
jgi:hypothetical protein